jgi:hypothetical protein
MRRFGRMQKHGCRSGAAQRGRHFTRNVAGFADTGHDDLAGVRQNQLDGANQPAVQPFGSARDGLRFNPHGGLCRLEPRLLFALGRHGKLIIAWRRASRRGSERLRSAGGSRRLNPWHR